MSDIALYEAVNQLREILDTIDPETEITSVESGSIVFHFSGSDDHSASEALTFECSLDGALFSACVSPIIMICRPPG